MGWRYRKSVKIAPGTRLNFSKSGVSMTNRVGNTGLYHRTQLAGGQKISSSSDSGEKKKPGCLLKIIVLLLILGALGSCVGVKSQAPAVPTAAPTATATATVRPTPTVTPEPTETPEPTVDPLDELRGKIDRLETAIENGEEWEQDFVLNTSTGVFHCAVCSDVSKIDPANRQYYTGVRSEVIAMGYTPCGHCMQ